MKKLHLIFIINSLVFLLISACLMNGEEHGSGRDSMLKFKKHTVRDTQGFGYEVFSILAPADWRFSGRVSWTFTQITPESRLTYTIVNPDGDSTVERFPDMNFLWSNDQMMRMSYEQAGLQVMKPLSPLDFARNVFIPRFKPNAVGVNVVGTRNLPDVAEQSKRLQQHLIMNVYNPISPLTFIPRFGADAVTVDIEYRENGRMISESLLVIVNTMNSSVPGMYGAVPFYAWNTSVTSFKTGKQQRGRHAVPFMIMARSARTNPRWGVDCTRLTATVTRQRLRRQQAIFNRMQQICRIQSEISDIIMDGYQKRDRAMDRIFDAYSESVRGVDSYIDPINNINVELPTGYDNAWTNGFDYIFSEDPDFNPNIYLTCDWTRMKQK